MLNAKEARAIATDVNNEKKAALDAKVKEICEGPIGQKILVAANSGSTSIHYHWNTFVPCNQKDAIVRYLTKRGFSAKLVQNKHASYIKISWTND